MPRNWYLLDRTQDLYSDVSAERVVGELLASRQPRRTVVVAAIDSGIDTAR